MSLQGRIGSINSQFISIFAVLDGWCDFGISTSEQNKSRSELLRIFLMETACVFESIRLKIPALATEKIANVFAPEPEDDADNHFNRDNCTCTTSRANGLRYELRQQLFIGLCLLDELNKIQEGVSSREINDSLWILEQILEKGNSFINQWTPKRSN